MSFSIWQGLLANFALVTIFVSTATHTYEWRANWGRTRLSASLGLLFGIGSIALMLSPVALGGGMYFDLHTTLIILSGFFAGPIAGIVTAVLAAGFRLARFSTGATADIIAIGIAATIGLVGHHLVRGRPTRRRDIVLLSLYGGIGSLAGLLALPQGLWSSTLSNAGLPVATLVLASTLIAGLAMLLEDRRRQSFEDNLTYRTIIECLPDSLNVKDAEGHFIAANSATARLMGATSSDSLVGRTDFDFYRPETAKAFRADEIAAMAADGPTTIEQEFRRPDGTRIWLATLKVPLRGASGEPVGLITHNRDISRRKSLELELATSQARLAGALAHMADGLAMFDRTGRLVFCNQQYRDFFPLTADLRVPGASLQTILRASIDRGEQVDVPPLEFEDWLAGVMASMTTATEQEVHRFDGRWLHVRSSPLEGGNAMMVVSDITKVKRAEAEARALSEQLKILATTDGLTGLANRRSFDDCLEREFARASRNRTPLSLFIVDIDRFKAFNDRYGHPAGDECLKRVTTAMSKAIKRPADTVARYGGEEFVAILPDTDEDGAFHLADALRLAVRDLQLEHDASEKGIVTVSVGVASYDGIRLEGGAPELLSRADEALYGAKAAGRDRVNGWTSEYFLDGAMPRRA